MAPTMLAKYAHLLVHYCLELQAGEKLYIKSTTMGEPLIREIYREALQVGALVEIGMSFREQARILLSQGTDEQLAYVSPAYQAAMENFDAYLFIRAPHNLREDQNTDPERSRKRGKALSGLMKTYFERTATRDLKRSLCQFPTQAAAQDAGMSLEEYEHFVYGACKLYEDDPAAAWRKVRSDQQKVVDHLNKCSTIHYKGPHVDLTFSTEGRTWINSDGRTNMPSGEVYTSPVEDSVQGWVRFSLPGVYKGQEVENVTLHVKDGYIEKWEATRGKELLDHIFSLEGTRRFGEAAVGTNYGITQMTRNILFDEKMGGTIHLAIGQSYLQAGGKNQSPVHWDMITDMREGGEILADGNRIYQNGAFTL